MKFVDKQLALKLKEKGFDKPCFGYYYIETPTGFTDGGLVLKRYYGRGATFMETRLSYTQNAVDSPTIDQVIEWLREKDIIIYCKPYHTRVTKNHIMYEWNVGVFNVDTKETKEDNKIVCLACADNDYGYVRYTSFDCIANYDDACTAAINFIIEHLI